MKKKKLLAVVLALLCFVTTLLGGAQATEAERLNADYTQAVYPTFEEAEKDYPCLSSLRKDEKLMNVLKGTNTQWEGFGLGQQYKDINNLPDNNYYNGIECKGFSLRYFLPSYIGRRLGTTDTYKKTSYERLTKIQFKNLFNDLPSGTGFEIIQSENGEIVKKHTMSFLMVSGNYIFTAEANLKTKEDNRNNIIYLVVRTVDDFWNKYSNSNGSIEVHYHTYKCNTKEHTYLFEKTLGCFVCSKCDGRSYCIFDYEGKIRPLKNTTSSSSNRSSSNRSSSSISTSIYTSSGATSNRISCKD